MKYHKTILGYFSPKANEAFSYKDAAGNWVDVVVPANGGCQFDEPRPGGLHKGLDLVGWVEKVSTDGNPPGDVIHLFDTTWKVYTLAGGTIGDKGTEGLTVVQGLPHTMDYKEQYQHMTPLTTQADGTPIGANVYVGALKSLGADEFTHLHYAITDDNETWLNPIGAAGNRGWTVTTVYVPEPGTAGLLAGALTGLAILRRRQRVLSSTP